MERLQAGESGNATDRYALKAVQVWPIIGTRSCAGLVRFWRTG